MTTELRVSDIAAASPDMNDAQFNELVEDIRRHGQLVPIWVCGDEVIDGRKRLHACQILGIEPKVVDIDDSENNPVIARALNVLRTHYSKSQISMFAAKIANLKRGHQKHEVNQEDNKCAAAAHLPRSHEQVAKEFGLGERVLYQAKRIRREGSSEIVAAVEAGKISTEAAEAIIQLPKEEQDEALQTRLEMPRNKRGARHRARRKVVSSGRRSLESRMIRTLDSLETAVELLGQFLDESGADDHGGHAKWMRRLYKARTGLSRIIKNHGGSDE